VISNQCIPISAVRINRLFFARTRANIDLLAHGTLLSTELHARSLQLSQCVAGHKILSKQQPGFPGWPFFRPNFKNLANFKNQVGWPKKFIWLFSLFFASSQVGCRLAFWLFIGLFMLKKFPLKNITLPLSSATHLQKFCNKCYIRPTPAFWY